VEVDELVGIEAFTGSMVHLSLQHLYQRVGEGEVPGADDLQAHFLKAWEENYDPARVKVINKGYEASDHLLRGRTALLAYHRRHHPFDRGQTVGLEKEIEFTMGGRHQFIGVIDRLTALGEGVYEVVDYKTGRRLPTPGDLKKDRQLGLYEVGVRQNFPDAREVRLVWHYLSHDKELRSSRQGDDLRILEKEVCDVVERIESAASFPCRRGPLCRWCEYQQLCL
jgi:putative RecB family exonuclease